jgi:uncharacterized membrane protein
MPYCCKCGNAVTPTDVYCAACGFRQPVAGPFPAAQYINGISPRTAALLCYIPIVGWIAAIVVLASTRFRADHVVRFHAFQGLYLFVAWLIVDWVLAPFFDFGFGTHMPHIPGLLRLAIFCFMIIKVSQHDKFKLPIVGELAEKSVSEQR